MASISAMISFIVLLLATYSSSAPVVPELQNATSVPQVENATNSIPLDNLVVLVRREISEKKDAKNTVSLSSSSSEDDADKTVQTTEKLALREMEDLSLPSISETNHVEREVDNEVNASFDDNNSKDERSFTEESFTTEVNTKRGIQGEQEQSFDDNNSKDERSVTEESFESSTVDETSVAPSSEVKNVKRSSDNGSWLSAQSNDDAERMKRSSDNGSWLSAQSNDDAERMKRSSDNGSWLSAQSNDDAERMKRSSDNGSWLSAQSNDDAERMKRSSDSGSWLSGDSNDEVRKRSIEDETSTVEDSSVPSTSKAINTRSAMGHSSSLSDEASQEFNRRAIGSVELDESSTMIAAKIPSESTTNEQPSSSTEVVREEMSSTFESETTVTPVDDFTRSSPVPSQSTSKILAIIPGQISKTQLVINPATGKTAGFRPADQIQLSQGQNQTISEEKKPNY